MTVTSVHLDHDRLTFTLIAEFDAAIDRVWELWSDPRKLESWWGPPTHPATVREHDLTPGGEVVYYMTGPDGERYGGLWRVTAVDPPRSLDVDSLFAHPDGTPKADMPVSRITVRLSEARAGTRMVVRTQFASHEDLRKWMDTGSYLGQQRAMAQIDALLLS